MTRRVRSESGQAIVVMVIFVSALIGGVSLTLDVGSWYREHRQAQTAADAAALAGAQALPADPSQALSVAQSYADKNGGGVVANGITFQSAFEPNDTVVVKITRTAPGFFSKLFSIDSAQVHATAAARSAVPIDVRWAAPIVVNKLQPDLSGQGCPCFGDETTIPLGKNGAPGSFALIDLNQSANGISGSSTVAGWIQYGFSGYLDVGYYYSDSGAKFESSDIGAALTARLGTALLFPVYDTLSGTGSTAQYHIIGWAAFHLDGFDSQGNSGSLQGYFTQVIWDGIQSASAPTGTDYGVHTIALVN